MVLVFWRTKGGVRMKSGWRDWAAAAAVLAAGAGLLGGGAACAGGVRQGLALCGGTLVPALFPFMALAGVLGRSGAQRAFARLTGPLCRRWLRLPEALGPVMLMSFVGGYPVGARMLSGMLARGEVTREDARRCLLFCISPAPSFAAAAVGQGVLGSARAGAVVYACHLGTALLLGRWHARRSPLPPSGANRGLQTLPWAAALVEGVQGAVEGMLSICGFVLLFSALLGLLEGLGAPAAAGALLHRLSGGLLSPQAGAAACSGVLEITCGVFACRGLGWGELCLLLPFLVSFGSLSVLCQVSACLRGRGIGMGPVLRGRMAHGLLCAAAAAPLLRRMGPALPAWAAAARPLSDPRVVLSSAGLLGLCSLLVLQLGGALAGADAFCHGGSDDSML